MAYIRMHETKHRSRGKLVKTYAVVYRAKVRTDDGRIVTRLRQETHATKAAAEARVAELNAHRHSHTTDPAERRKRGQRSVADWSTDWLASQRVKVASGHLKRARSTSTADCWTVMCCRSWDTCPSRR